jgi:zinc transporter, ZIP family
MTLRNVDRSLGGQREARQMIQTVLITVLMGFFNRVKYITYVMSEHKRRTLYSLSEILLLGGVAGFTIFLGLPVMLFRISDKKKGLLNATAIGILLFLVVDVLGKAWQSTVQVSMMTFGGGGSAFLAALNLLAMFGGMAIGLLGLVAYEKRYLRRTQGSPGLPGHKLATMIALGIGAHNLSEGLAIGQSYVSGAVSLAILLVIGFGAHNATEGFGILAPLTGVNPKPKVSFLVKVLAVGGVPTFIGTVLGSMFYSAIAYVLFLSLAGGALVYVIMMMYNAGKRQTTNDMLMLGIFFGICAGFLTDLIVTLGGA